MVLLCQHHEWDEGAEEGPRAHTRTKFSISELLTPAKTSEAIQANKGQCWDWLSCRGGIGGLVCQCVSLPGDQVSNHHIYTR